MRKSESELFREEARKYDLGHKVHIVEGGEHRQQSVANALNALRAAEDDIVLVHDAVRPFVTSETIAAVIAAVKKHGAAIAGVPAVDTIKQVERTADGAVITATIPREMIVQAQTPQGFRFAVLKRAFEDATAEGFLGTDEASLLERLGQPVHVVMGSANNIKITTPADLELAEFFISLENRRQASISG
jgi:2-C-methyl-D-erythritol 4-phosphate cytidylyltransferase